MQLVLNNTLLSLKCHMRLLLRLKVFDIYPVIVS